MKKYVSVRTRYYKKSSGESLENHIYRVIENGYDATKNRNIFVNRMHLNFYKRFVDKGELRKKQKLASGRRPRSDFNEVFEHLLIFSRDQVKKIEKKAAEKNLPVESIYKTQIDFYCAKIKNKYGFEPIGYAFHLDEGYMSESGEFMVNPHCHIEFYNYDFENKVAPLKKIQKKINVNGKNQTNPAFSDFQDIASEVFSRLGFERGERKAEVLKEHLEKEEYVKSRLVAESVKLNDMVLKKELIDVNTRDYFIKETVDGIERFIKENPGLVNVLLKVVNSNARYGNVLKKAKAIFEELKSYVYKINNGKKNNSGAKYERRTRKITNRI